MGGRDGPPKSPGARRRRPLRRPEGPQEEGRYRRIDVVARRAGRVLGRACVRLDLADRRARIVRLESATEGAQGTTLGAALRVLHAGSAGRVASTVIDVRADAPRLHATLERMRFFPSAYLPAVLATPTGYSDVVQYTRLTSGSIKEAAELVADLAWPQAWRVIGCVVALARWLG